MADELEIPGAQIEEINEKTVDKNVELIDKDKIKARKEEEDKLAKEAKELNGGLRVCPRCGHDTTIEVIAVTTADKSSFIKSLLGDKPYTKAFFAMGKNIELMFETTDSWFTDLIREQLIIDHRQRRISTAEEYRAMMYKYYMVGCLTQVIIGGESRYKRDPIRIDKASADVKPPEQGDTMLVEAVKEVSCLWKDSILTTVLETMARFHGEVELMTRHSNDEDFWKSVN